MWWSNLITLFENIDAPIVSSNAVNENVSLRMVLILKLMSNSSIFQLVRFRRHLVLAFSVCKTIYKLRSLLFHRRSTSTHHELPVIFTLTFTHVLLYKDILVKGLASRVYIWIMNNIKIPPLYWYLVYQFIRLLVVFYKRRSQGMTINHGLPSVPNSALVQRSFDDGPYPLMRPLK